jgi:hypothetical protein
MSLAMRGFDPLLKGGTRRLVQSIPGGQSARSYHLSSFLPVRPLPVNAHVFGLNIQAHARVILARVLNHLTLPHATPLPRNLSRSMHSPASATIRQSLSLPARTALAQPLRTGFFPKTPFVPRNTTSVGIGSVRNFCNSRHVFQNIVDNVPVAARAFVEADLDLQKKGENRARLSKSKRTGKSSKGRKSEMQQPRETNKESKTELDHYFASAIDAVPSVYTILTIPLAPVNPRVPLPTASTVEIVADTHAQFSTHTLKVASLFRRLDAAKVWDKGVSCDCLGDGEEGDAGICTELRVKFDGWTEQKVREVLGDRGRGWTCMKEHRAEESLSPLRLSPSPNMETNSFIMPTLDFSSTFLTTPVYDNFIPPTSTFSSAFTTRSSSPAPSPPSSPFTQPSVGFDNDEMGSDSDSLDGGWAPSTTSSTGTGVLGFSSEFVSRAGSESSWQSFRI